MPGEAHVDCLGNHRIRKVKLTSKWCGDGASKAEKIPTEVL